MVGKQKVEREVIIHIGAHKTGTTSIQQFLKINTQNLAVNDWALFCKRPEGFEAKDGSANSWVEFSGVRDEFKAVINQDLFRRLEASKSRNLIISSEEFFWLDNKKDIESFAHSIKRIFSKITIVAYLRRQDLHFLSHYQQGFKFPESSARAFYGCELTLRPVHKDYYARYLNYSYKLSMWEDAFSGANFIIREYSKSSLLNGDSVADFCSLFPFDTTGWTGKNFYSNETLNKEQLIVNHSLFNVRNDLWYELGKGSFTKHRCFREFDKVNLKAVELEDVMRFYAKSNEKLEKYIPNLKENWDVEVFQKSFENNQLELTEENYKNALNSLVSYFDQLSMMQLFFIKLKKFLKVFPLQRYIRKLAAGVFR